MRIVSNTAAFPRDNRAWPRGAFGFSVACAVVALAGSAALVASADSVAQAAGLLVTFLALTGLETATFLNAVRPLLEGEQVPVRTRLVQVGLVVLTLLAFVAGAKAGGAAVCGFLTGVFAPTAWAIRHARINRGLERAAENEPGTQMETVTPMATVTDIGTANATVTEPVAGTGTSEEPVTAKPADQPRVDQPPVDQPAMDQPAMDQIPDDQIPEDRAPDDRTPIDQSAPRASARRIPRIGPVLREALAESTGRLLAWAAATTVTVVGCATLGTPDSVVQKTVFVGVCILLWVAVQTAALWVAEREFERAATVPKRRYVVLVKDPSPHSNRPMLGMWTTEPAPQDGRLPRAEAVYLCDGERRALISSPGALVVHEAWVALGSRALSTPRWVAADAGVALPTRRAFLGWRSLGSVIEAERPARARPLTMRAPHPNTERTSANVQVIMKEERVDSRWIRVFAWRLAVMVAVAVVFTLLNR